MAKHWLTKPWRYNVFSKSQPFTWYRCKWMGRQWYERYMGSQETYQWPAKKIYKKGIIQIQHETGDAG